MATHVNLNTGKNDQRDVKYTHPPFKQAENISKTDVRYEAPRIPTNQYDVELYKLKMERMDKDKPFRIAEYCGLFGLGIAGVAILWYCIKTSIK